MIKSLVVYALALLAAVAVAAPVSADSNVFLKATAGGSYPLMNNLDAELKAQGRSGLAAGLSVSVSLGRMFAKRKWGAELWFDHSRFKSFEFENEYESFEGDMTHYSFMLVGKRNLWPSNDIFRPYIGAGLGYGYADIARAGGKIDGVLGMVLLQLESRIKDNVTLFLESAYTAGLSEAEYDSSFLEGSAYDAILDSSGDPLSDRLSSVDLRIGIQAWLKPPRKYGH